MIKYYLLDSMSIFRGTVERGPYDPVPIPASITPPPDTSGTEVAQWDGTQWHVLPDRPPAPAPQQPAPPASVTRAQGKATLIQAGLWDGVLAYVDGIADPTQKALAQVALDDTLEWRRDSPFLGAATAALGLAPEQLDDLFRQAATIEF